VSILRRTAVSLGLVALSWMAWRVAVPTVHAAGVPDATVDDAVAATAAVGVVLVLAWVWVSLVAHAAAALPGTIGRIGAAVAGAVTPAACRGAVRVLLGVTSVATPVVPVTLAYAVEPAPYGFAASPTAAADADLADLPGIDRPTMVAGWVPTVPPPAPPTAPHVDVRVVASPPAETEAVLDEVVVRRGDTLWDIAARALGTQATAVEIAAEWPRWYAANRDVIGADPDLIYPGTVLNPPTR
jgi:hypothetical protein